MILSTRQQFVDCLSMNEDSQYIGTYKHLTLNSVFQPIFDTTNTIIGVEALVRIHDLLAGPIRPDQFFHNEDINFDDKISVERLSRVIHIRNFARSQYRHLKLFLNVLPSAGEYLALGNIDASLLAQRLKALNLDNSQLVMEIVELNASNEETLKTATRKLSASDFNIAVDDFGVNASNRQRAERLKPDIIKLDRSLLLAYMAGDQFRLMSGIKLAKILGSKVVVEGVETSQQLEAMRNLDIDLFQGYFLGVPEPLPAVYIDESNNLSSIGDPSIVYHQLYQ
ncbi:EAL domain-containing protein [Vibrio bivalvicida]|uniref:Diguanylate phosphodiesterase n=1 Tax=Vibrio bivalvicida TaxID=1276888 RepID=A0A177Y4M2_9VIBR|nr:EAL domain-containing protein [Vibrio bivalvicida]OAJ95810.1 diguanylate phosphodiesterase [Vibrio bivalvicida]